MVEVEFEEPKMRKIAKGIKIKQWHDSLWILTPGWSCDRAEGPVGAEKYILFLCFYVINENTNLKCLMYHMLPTSAPMVSLKLFSLWFIKYLEPQRQGREWFVWYVKTMNWLLEYLPELKASGYWKDGSQALLKGGGSLSDLSFSYIWHLEPDDNNSSVMYDNASAACPPMHITTTPMIVYFPRCLG